MKIKTECQVGTSTLKADAISYTSELCHAKTRLKIFAIVIPKEDLDLVCEVHPHLGENPYSIIYKGQFYCRCHTKRKLGWYRPRLLLV